MHAANSQTQPAAMPAAWPIALQGNPFSFKRFALFFALLIALVFAEVLLGQKTFYYRDFGLFGYPLAYFHKESFLDGNWPLWNSLNFCGIPFLAQWNTMTLYPPTLIYLLFPLSWSLGVFCLLHLVLGALGMYCLARHWTKDDFAACLGGLAYGFNGLTWYSLMWPNNIAALGWMPWIVLLADRAACQGGGRKLVWLAVAGSLQMLSGAPEIIVFTWVIAGIFWALHWWQDPARGGNVLRVALSAIGLVFLICGVQLLPFLELLGNSQRGVDYADATWSMPGTGWANFLVPMFHMQPSFHGQFTQANQGWIHSYYLGAGTLGLALVAILFHRKVKVWILSFLAMGSLILSLGSDGYLFAWIQSFLPQIGFMRFPIKFVVLAIFALPLLAAFGVQGLTSAPPGRGRKTLLGVAAFLLIAMAGLLVFAWCYPLRQEPWSVTWQNTLWRGVFLTLILVGLALFSSMARDKRSAWLLGFGVLILLWADLFTHAPNLAPGVERWVYSPGIFRVNQAWTEPLRPGQARAMVTPAAHEIMSHQYVDDREDNFVANRLALFGNCNMLDEVPKLSGMFSLHLPRAEDILYLLWSQPMNAAQGLQDFLGVAAHSNDRSPVDWEPRPSWMPMVTAGQAPVYYRNDDVLQRLVDPQFDPRRQVLLPEDLRESMPETTACQAAVNSVDYRPQKLNVEVNAPEPTMLVIAQSHYPAWQATVNGRPTPILRANHAFQAVAIPAGTSRVELNYHDRAFHWGGLLTLTGIALCVWLWRRRA